MAVHGGRLDSLPDPVFWYQEYAEEDLGAVWEEDLTVPLQVISLHPRSIRELIPQSSNGESDQISRLCKARAEEIHQLSRHLKWNRRSVQAWRRK
ncbi:hypothetical protein LXL04_016068 [Taraxacum kok-saghyz]